MNIKRLISKIIIIGVIVVSEVSITTGCATNTDEKKNNAETLLEKKYNEKFSVYEYGGKEPMQDWYTVRAYSIEYPDIIFKAEIDTDNRISDNYVQRRVGCALKDTIEESFKDLNGGFVVFATPTTYYTVSTDPDITPEKFNEENPTNDFYICLFFDQSIYDGKQIYEYVKKAVSELKDLKGCIEVVLTEGKKIPEIDTYFTRQDDMYSELDDLLSDSKRSDIRYENGNVLTEYEEFIGGLR